jgi:hypothetical protein
VAGLLVWGAQEGGEVEGGRPACRQGGEEVGVDRLLFYPPGVGEGAEAAFLPLAGVHRPWEVGGEEVERSQSGEEGEAVGGLHLDIHRQ